MLFDEDQFAVCLYPDQTGEGIRRDRHHFSGERVFRRDLFELVDELKARLEEVLCVELGEARVVNVVAIG